MLIKLITNISRAIWDGMSYFFGFPYEEQAKKIDSEKMDPALRGPENPVTSHQAYRANKVQKTPQE